MDFMDSLMADLDLSAGEPKSASSPSSVGSVESAVATSEEGEANEYEGAAELEAEMKALTVISHPSARTHAPNIDMHIDTHTHT